MDYYKYQIQAKSDQSEILLAFLSDLPFDTFQETDSGLDAFVPVDQDSEEIEVRLKQLADQYDFHYEKVFLKAKNWNAIWESNFQPILVNNFCSIRAAFHEPAKGVEHEILINPKMAFGTGHHATTYMVIEHMSDLDFKNKSVLDYGCGTGILAILAVKLGASAVEAVDIESASFENTRENASINKTEGIHVLHGTLDVVQRGDFDLILANINRNVILESLPSLYDKLNKNGKLIVSGFIEKDAPLLLDASEKAGFTHLKSKINDNWISMILQKA